jgi:hypothetical protein
VLWWSFYGHKQSSDVSAASIEHLPRYLFDAVSSGLASATGLVHGGLPGAVSSGHVLTVLGVLFLLWWLVRGGRPGPWSIVFAGTAVTFWVLTGASTLPGRVATASRYQLTSAVLLILLTAELLRGPRLGRGGLVVLSALTVLVVGSNLAVMRHGYDFMRVESQNAKVDLGAMQLAGIRALPNVQLTTLVVHDPYLSGVTPGRYFAETSIHGSPPFDSANQIASSPLSLRVAADGVLASVYGIALRPAGAGHMGTSCARLPAGSGQAGPAAVISVGSTLLKNLTDVPLVIGVSHFASGRRPVYIGFLAGRATTQLVVPAASAKIGWRVSFTAGSRAVHALAAVCRA